jgi:hypothetical protein
MEWGRNKLLLIPVNQIERTHFHVRLQVFSDLSAVVTDLSHDVYENT